MYGRVLSCVRCAKRRVAVTGSCEIVNGRLFADIPDSPSRYWRSVLLLIQIDQVGKGIGSLERRRTTDTILSNLCQRVGRSLRSSCYTCRSIPWIRYRKW